MVRIDEREGEGTSGLQSQPELVHELQHIRAWRIREDRIGDDVVEGLGHARQGESGNAFRVEEEASAIIGNPVRLGESPAATFDGLLAHVDAPVAFGIDVRVGITQDVADVAPEVQHVLVAPIRLAQLNGEVGELVMLLRYEGQHDSPLIDGVQARAASSRANSDDMRHRWSASALARSAVSRPGRMDLSLTVSRA